jgi:hypothetical protein
MFCPKCGAEVKEGSEYCGKCGTKLNKLTSQEKTRSSFSKAIIPVAAGILVIIAAAIFGPKLFLKTVEETIEPTATLPPKIEPTQKPTHRPTLADTLTPTSAPMLEVPMGGYPYPGPWLIFATTNALWVANSDGSGVNALFGLPVPELGAGVFDLPSGISPNGTMLALRKTAQSGVGYDLVIETFPLMTEEKITPILNEEWIEVFDSNSELPPDIVNAVLDWDALAWSPGGRYLAFVAALEESAGTYSFSSDLYVYDTVTKTIKRMTSGALEVALPIWTPDSDEILYQSVKTFGSGAGWTNGALWAVSRDGENDRLIDDTWDEVGPVEILGISKSEFMLTANWSQYYPSVHLINLNDPTEDEEVCWGNTYGADIDIETGSVACIDQAGELYLKSNPKSPKKKIDGDFTGFNLYWSKDMEEFVVTGQTGLWVLSTSGELKNLADHYAIAYFAPDGIGMCMVDPTLVCYANGPFVEITKTPNVIMTWAPDSSGFFYIDNNVLYYVPTTDFLPRKVMEDLLPVQFKPYGVYGFRMKLENIGWLKAPEK